MIFMKIKNIINELNGNDFELVCDKIKKINCAINKISINDLNASNANCFIVRTSFTYNSLIVIEKNKNGFFVDGQKWELDKISEIDMIDIYEVKEITKEKSINDHFLSESTIYFIISFFVNIFLFSLSLVINYYIKIVFDRLIPSQNLKLILLISITFLIINCFKIISNILLNIYEVKRTNIISSKIYEKALAHNYYSGNSNFIKNFNYLNIYIKKYIFDRPDFYSSIFINIIIFFISIFMNYFLGFIILLSITTSIVISYIKFKINNVYISKNIELQNNLSNKMLLFNNFCSSEKNHKKFLHYKNNVMSELNKNINNNESYKLHEYKILLINDIVTKLIYFLSVITISYVIIAKDYLTISTLLIFLGLIDISNTNSNIIFNFLSTYKEYKDSKNIHNEIINFKVENKNINKIPNKISCKDIKLTGENKIHSLNEIILKNDTLIYGKNGIGKTSLFKSLLDPENILNNNLCFNDFIYQTSKTNLDLINWSDLMADENFGEFISLLKKFNINDLEKLSQGEQQILSFILLIFEKNKIILLDETLSNVDKKNRQLLLKDIKPIIENNNLLIMISHNSDDRKYFKYKENLNERI